MSEDTSWDDRLRSVLTDEWQSSEHLAARLHAKPHTVLARLKDMMRRNLVERRLASRAGKTAHVAQFRLLRVAGRSVPESPKL